MKQQQLSSWERMAPGVIVSLGLIIALSTSMSMEGGLEYDIDRIATKVMDASLPMSTTDVLSITFGEAVAGVIGAAVTYVLSIATMNLRSSSSSSSSNTRRSSSSSSSTGGEEKEEDINNDDTTNQRQQGNMNIDNNRQMMLSQAVADGDFFVANAALFPLLEAAGLPPFLATVSSVAVSMVPYELTKLAGIKRIQKRAAEDQLMRELLLEQRALQERQRQNRNLQWGVLNFWERQSNANSDERSSSTSSSSWPLARFFPTPLKPSLSQPPTSCDVNTLVPIQAAAITIVTTPDVSTTNKSSLDAVAVISDLIKWLEFDVLKDYSGMFRFNGQALSPGIEGAIFGSLAATSSQLYADVLSASYGFGSPERREEVKARSMQDWINIYTTKVLNSAALFGVYSAVQYPVKRAILELITGGVDSCLGSEEFDLCMQVFEAYNPPGASLEAELRGLITALVSLSSRFAPSLLYIP